MLGVGALLTGAFFFLNSHTQTVGRDFDRLSDMDVARSAFERLFQDEASYASAGCEEGEELQLCLLSDYDPNIVNRQDPGDFSYVVAETPSEDSFAIRFTLERTYRGLEAGDHLLTENGIQ